MSSESTTAVSLLARLSAGETSSEEVVRSLLGPMPARRSGSTSSSISIRSGILAQARAIDARRKDGEMVGRLAGVPVAIKDVLCVEGEPTTCGSRMLRNFRPPYDATRDRQAQGRRRDLVRQDQHGRVCDGLVDGE